MATQDISQLVVDVKSKGIQTAATQLDRLATSSDKAEKAVRKLGTSVINVNGTLGGGVSQTAALVASMTSLTAVMSRLSQSQTRATVTTRQNNEAMREAHALARGLSGSLGALWVTYGNLAGMAIGVALGASLKGVVTIGADVEHTLEKVRVLGQASNGEIAQMSKLVTELGQGAQGPRDVAQAFSVLTLAGLNAKEAMRGVGAALNLAVTGDVSVEKASETLVQVATALGYSSKSFDHIGDVIAKTAAVSMSSVESISASFMSAAASGEVYGARLEDMALGLAALANLGIKATAAGTAQKNFYKDLSSGTGNTTQALKMMGLALDDLKNADGKFIPMYDIILKMDEGLGKLSPKVRTLVMDMANGERGIKQSASLIGLLYQDGVGKAGEAISKLKQMRDEIADSAAFSSMAAMAMSQTTLNQMKAVGNTLQSSFVDVFKSVSPEISAISRQLKEAFKSDDFKKSLTTLVVNLAILTKALVDNGRTIITVIASVAALKIGLGLLGGGIAAVQGSIVGIAAVKAAWAATTGGALVTSLARAGIAVRLFQASLGPLGLAIAALTTLWVLYENSKQKAIGKPVETENLKGMVGEISEQVKKEQKELGLRKRALAENTTYEKLLRGQEIEDQRKSYDAQIQASDKAVTKLEANAFRRGAAGAMAAKQARAEHNKLKAELDAQHKLLVQTASQKNAMDDAEAQRLKAATGTIGMPEKVDKSAISERYYTYIQMQEQVIAKARADMDNQREVAELQRRSGLITELDMVYKIGKAQSEYDKTRIAAIAEEARIAGSTKGKGADVARYTGELARAKEEQAQSQKVLELKVLDASFAAHEAATNAKIKSEEKLGNFRAAAELKWGATNKKAYEEALQNAQTYGGIHVELVKQFEGLKAAAIAEGAVKEEAKDFDIAIQRTQNTLKGFKANIVGKSFVDMWQAAQKATKRYNEELVDAQKEYEDLRKLASGPEASDFAIKEAEEAMGRLLKVSDNFRQMWVGTGEQIAKGLESAFGEAGKTLGDLVKVSAEYQAQKDKSFETEMAYYGNLAGAASGYFDKQSKGYKVLNSVSQAFHILSMARTLKETAANVASAAAKFFAQSGWGGFAGVAAMGAVLAGLGYAMSGSGGSGGQTAEEVQKTQGTGSVFGDADAKSDSINRSIDTLKNNSSVMLPINQAMLASLRGIEAAMGGLANLVLRASGITDGTNMGIQTGQIAGPGVGSQLAGGAVGAGVGYMAGAGFSAFTALGAVGGPIGMAIGAVLGATIGKLWGSTKQAIVDSGLQMGGKVSDLQAGKGFNQYASVDTTKKSWFGLSKKTTNSVQTQGLNNELSAQFGLVFTNLEETLKIAGGSFGKTAAEVQNTIDNLVISTSSISLKDLKGDELEAAINAVISKTMDEIAMAAIPAMDAFRKVGEGYAETVIRVASGIEQAKLATDQLHIATVSYTQVQNKQGDVAAEIVRQSILAKEGLSGVGDMLKNMSGTMEDLVNTYKALDAIRTQMNLTGLNGDKLDVGTVRGAGGVTQLKSSLDTYQDKYFTDQEKAGIMLKSVTAEFSKLNVTLPANKAALRALIEQTSTSNPELTGQLLSLADAYDKTVEAVEKAQGSQSKSLEDTIKGLKAFGDALKAFKDSLALGDLSILTPTEKYLEAKRQYEDTVAKAMAGDSTAKDAYTGIAQAYLDASRTVNASSQGYTDSYNKVLADIEMLGTSNAAELSNAEKQLAAAEKQVTLLEMLNATVSGVPTAPKLSASPATSSAPVVVDTAALEAQIVDLKRQMAEQAEASAKQMQELKEVVYNSNVSSGEKIADVVGTAVESTAFYARNSKLNEQER